MALPDKPRDRKQTLLMIWAGADLTAPAKPARDREEGYLYYLSGVDTETALPALPCRDRREMYMAYKAGQIDTLPTLPARDSTEQYWEVICGRSETLPLIPRDSTQQILEVIAENSAAPTEDITVIGVSPIVLEDAVSAKLISLTQYGKMEQAGTPTPSAPVDIICNNGVLKAGNIIDGTPEVISIGGKNLNGGTLENKGYTSTGGESTSTTFAGTLWQIPTKSGEKFTVSWGGFPDGVSGVFINTWKTDNTWNARQAISASTSLTYTVGDGVGKINFTLYKTGGITIGENAWLQVEYGTSATDYEPYREPQTANAPNIFAVGDYADDADIISGAVNRYVGIKVFDGTETIGTSNACFTVPISNKVTTKTALLCSHFQYSSKTSSQTDDETIISFASTNIGFRYDACADKAAFAKFLADQYVAGTPVIVIYPLAEESEESVTPQDITLAEGDNTLTVIANVDDIDLEVTYRKLVSE